MTKWAMKIGLSWIILLLPFQTRTFKCHWCRRKQTQNQSNRHVQANMSHKDLRNPTIMGGQECWWKGGGSGEGEDVCWWTEPWGHWGIVGRSVLKIWTGKNTNLILKVESWAPSHTDKLYAVKVKDAIVIAGKNYGFVTFSSSASVEELLETREPLEVAGSKVILRQVFMFGS